MHRAGLIIFLQLIELMNVKLEKFDSGWIGISLALTTEDIDSLLQRLNLLKLGELTHFHIRNDDFSRKEGVADIELTTIGEGESNNMVID